MDCKATISINVYLPPKKNLNSKTEPKSMSSAYSTNIASKTISEQTASTPGEIVIIDPKKEEIEVKNLEIEKQFQRDIEEVEYSTMKKFLGIDITLNSDQL